MAILKNNYKNYGAACKYDYYTVFKCCTLARCTVLTFINDELTASVAFPKIRIYSPYKLVKKCYIPAGLNIP
jgi:hypothetical protein